MKKAILTGFAAAVLALGAAVEPAQAELNSSMTARCSDAACSAVIFRLTTSEPGTHWLWDMSIFASNGWLFDGVAGNVAIESGGVDYTSDYSIGFTGGDLIFQSGGASTPLQAALPVYITVGIGTPSTAGWSSFVYDGDLAKVATPTAPGDIESIGGTVTPEPVTTVLLGTGLVGLLAVGARRRRSLLEDEEGAA